MKLLTSLLVLLCCLTAGAKTFSHDADIRTGRLSNGLTYYVVPSHNTSYYVHMYLCTNIGSVVETPEEWGMAHFIEHCVFDGSKNFPDKSLKASLEATGLKFGRDFNASTSYDFTQYYTIGVNGLSKDCIELAMTALHDMGNCADLSDEAIESERKIILEEWRQGNGASERVSEQMREHLFGKDSPYVHPIIGNEQTISNFTPEALRAFYDKWYQPHHQAIVVVGFFEPGEIVNLIKKVWKDVPAAQEPSVREWPVVPDLDGMRAKVITDPEFQGCQIDMWFPAQPWSRDKRNTSEYLAEQFAAQAAAKIANNRLQEVMFAPGAPWSGTKAEWTSYYNAESRDAFRLLALYDRNIREKALATLIAQAKSLAEYGVSQAELDRVVDELRAHAKTMALDYEETAALARAAQIIYEFNTGNVYLDGKTQKKVYESFCDTVTVEGINSYLRQWIRPENLAISMTESYKDNIAYPTHDELYALTLRLWDETVAEAPANEEALSRPLLAKDPVPGKIVGESEETEFNAHLYTLSNGARVAIASRNNEQDHLMVRAVRRGGKSKMLPQGFAEGYYADDLANLCGMGDFSRLDLKRKLAGTKVDIEVSQSLYGEIVDGECRVDELETLLQLFYLRFTEMREDSALVDTWRKTAIGQLNDRRNDPDRVFSDSIISIVYGADNLYKKKPTAMDVAGLDAHKALEMMQATFSNAAEWDFIITGNVKLKEAVKLVLKYIGSLPGDPQSAKPDLEAVDYVAREGSNFSQFELAMEKPFSRVYHLYELHRPFELADEMAMEVLENLLQRIFIEIIREQAGAAYTPRVDVASSEINGMHRLEVTIDTNAEMTNQISQAITLTLKALSQYGVDEELYNQVYRLLTEDVGMSKFNQLYPMRFYTHQALYHDRCVAERPDALARVTPDTIQQLAHDLLRAPARYTIIMTGTPMRPEGALR